MEKGTMTGLALKHMVENSFSEAEGARPAGRNIPRIGLVFTDGRSQDDITEYAKKAKDAGKTPDQRRGTRVSVLKKSDWLTHRVGNGRCNTHSLDNTLDTLRAT